MTAEKFEKIKKDLEEKRKEDVYIRIGTIWGTIKGLEDITREETLKLFDILFPPVTLDDIINN